jgi:MFS family permease
MFKWPLLEVPGTSRRDFSLVFTLLFNAFTWSYIILMIIGNIQVDATIRASFSTVFSIAASGAGLSGALFSQRINRLNFLRFWMILGLASSIPLIFIENMTVTQLSLTFILLGISFGLGMPSSLAHLADKSQTENRASIGSLILLAANLSTLPLALFVASFSSVSDAVILIAWRGLGLVTFLLLTPKEDAHPAEAKQASFASVFRDRSFILYLVPWVMFSMIDVFEKSFLANFVGSSRQAIMLTIEPLVAVLFLFAFGLLADRIGRKRVTIYGFVSLGIGYALVGLAPKIEEIWYFYFVVDGMAWSIFFTVFLLTLAGDLSRPNAREKYYAVASFPYVIRSAIALLFASALTSVEANAAFSLASFFLFLAVLPLMYAPETLPEKKIELRRLKRYIEQAKKLKGKNT